MMEKVSTVKREQLVKIQANNAKCNPKDGVWELQYLESWSYEVDRVKTWNFMTNFAECKP